MCNSMSIAASALVIIVCCVLYSGAQWTPDPFCPYPYPDHVTRYPYYGNCSVYWECYNGAKYVMECEEGLEFNAVLEQCDAPEIANCDPLASTTQNASPPPTNDITEGTTSTTEPGPVCPFPSEEHVFFPYEGDCTKYWECYRGDYYLYTCPPGLWWHPELETCDNPGDFCTYNTTPSTNFK